MLEYMDPQITSIERSYNSDDVVKFRDIQSKPVLQILKGGDSPWTSIELNRESKQYFIVKAINIDESYDKDGNKVKDIKEYEFVRCSKNYMSSFFEDQYVKYFNSDYLYCLEDENVELRDIKDKRYIKEGHKFVMVTVTKCTEETRNTNQTDPNCRGADCETVDPKCKSHDEIEKYLDKKKMYFETMNTKLDFSSRE